MIHTLNRCYNFTRASGHLTAYRVGGSRPAVHAIMAQKSITAFFQTTEKRKAGTGSDERSTKKVQDTL